MKLNRKSTISLVLVLVAALSLGALTVFAADRLTHPNEGRQVTQIGRVVDGELELFEGFEGLIPLADAETANGYELGNQMYRVVNGQLVPYCPEAFTREVEELGLPFITNIDELDLRPGSLLPPNSEILLPYAFRNFTLDEVPFNISFGEIANEGRQVTQIGRVVDGELELFEGFEGLIPLADAETANGYKLGNQIYRVVNGQLVPYCPEAFAIKVAELGLPFIPNIDELDLLPGSLLPPNSEILLPYAFRNFTLDEVPFNISFGEIGDE